jgi:hypothetical protein
VTFTVPPGTSKEVATLLVNGQVIEASHYLVDPSGLLILYNLGPEPPPESDEISQREDIICYAPGVWRSIAELGAFTKAIQQDGSENPRRPQEARPTRAP